jgi:hypothetical protein
MAKDKNMMLVLIVVLLIVFVMNSNYTTTIQTETSNKGIDISTLKYPIDRQIVSFVQFMSQNGLILALLPGTYLYDYTAPVAAVGIAPAVSETAIWTFNSTVAGTTNTTPTLSSPFDPTADVMDNVYKSIALTTQYGLITIGIVDTVGTFHDISSGLMDIGVMPIPDYSLCDCYVFLDQMISTSTRFAVRTATYGSMSGSSGPFADFGTQTTPKNKIYYLSNPGITITTPDFGPVGDYVCRYSGQTDNTTDTARL